MKQKGDWHPSRQRSWVEIDLDAVANNMRVIRAAVGPKTRIMVIVKADAYNHGAVDFARAALTAGADRMGVATCLEGVELRQAGINCPIQVLGALLPEEVGPAIENNIIISVHDLYVARLASLEATRQNRDATVHLKIDTGMGRLGFLPQNLVRAALEVKKLPQLQIEGLFMHLSEAQDREFAEKQLDVFDQGHRELAEAGVKIPIRHAANSFGTLAYPRARYEQVRPGIISYGVMDKHLSREQFPLRAVMSWRSHVIQIKDYPAGCTIGYCRTYVTSRPTRVAVLPVGYADGYNRAFSNKSQVLVNGRRCPVIGRVSMDYTMIDATDAGDVPVGTVGTLLGLDGEERITAEELTALVPGHINHELFTGIGKRVGRVLFGQDCPETLAKSSAPVGLA